MSADRHWRLVFAVSVPLGVGEQLCVLEQVAIAEEPLLDVAPPVVCQPLCLRRVVKESVDGGAECLEVVRSSTGARSRRRSPDRRCRRPRLRRRDASSTSPRPRSARSPRRGSSAHDRRISLKSVDDDRVLNWIVHRDKARWITSPIRGREALLQAATVSSQTACGLGVVALPRHCRPGQHEVRRVTRARAVRSPRSTPAMSFIRSQRETCTTTGIAGSGGRSFAHDVGFDGALAYRALFAAAGDEPCAASRARAPHAARAPDLGGEGID